MLHTADISHPAKAWELHHRWTMSLLEEFFRQVPCCFVPPTGVTRGYSLTFIFQQHCDQDCCDYSYLLFEGMVHSFYLLVIWCLTLTYVLILRMLWYFYPMHFCLGGKTFSCGNFLSKYHLRYAFTFFPNGVTKWQSL